MALDWEDDREWKQVRRPRRTCLPANSVWASLLADTLSPFALPLSTVASPRLQTTHAPGTDARFSVPLRGVDVAPDTRCTHYDDPHDVIAIRFACCEVYHPCFRCHRAVTDHAPMRWPAERRDEPAVLCGACGTTITARAYQTADHECPYCGAAFNPGCRAHWDRYFAFE